MFSRPLPPITSLFPGILSTPSPLFLMPRQPQITPFVEEPIQVLPPKNFVIPERINAIPQPNKTVKSSVLKNKFTAEEDKLLLEIASKTKVHNWNEIAKKVGTRNARQCRERWNNYLNPSLRNDPWTEEEDKLLINMHAEYGTHWNKISKHFSNRSDNAIRNRWQLLMRHLEKRNSSSSQSSPSQMSD